MKKVLVTYLIVILLLTPSLYWLPNLNFIYYSDRLISEIFEVLFMFSSPLTIFITASVLERFVRNFTGFTFYSDLQHELAYLAPYINISIIFFTLLYIGALIMAIKYWKKRFTKIYLLIIILISFTYEFSVVSIFLRNFPRIVLDEVLRIILFSSIAALKIILMVYVFRELLKHKLVRSQK